MKQNIFYIALVLAFFAFTFGTCNKNQAISLAKGESATRKLDGVPYTILITDIRDSRCPKDVKCIRAGEAIVSVEILKNNTNKKQLEFCTGIDCRRASISDVHPFNTGAANYEMKLLSVTPDPGQTKSIATKKANFEIVKK